MLIFVIDETQTLTFGSILDTIPLTLIICREKYISFTEIMQNMGLHR